MRLLIDINVLLDVLANRDEFAEEAAGVLSHIERGKAVGLMAAHTATTVFYLLRRELGPKRARRAIMDTLRLLEVIPVDEDRLLQALAMDWDDFEDALQAACAAKAEADYIVTRNEADFAAAEVEVLSPGECLALLAAEN